MTSKPDSVSTLGYHWTDHTGRPLEPQVHWDATGTTLADASTQWCSSGDPVLICIIGTHWKTIGKPLEDHWKTTGSTLAILQWHSSVHWGLSSRHTAPPHEKTKSKIEHGVSQLPTSHLNQARGHLNWGMGLPALLGGDLGCRIV